MNRPLFQDEIKNRVREHTDIVRLIGESIELKKAGANFVGLCPFHSEKTPSFSVSPSRQFFHCFGCGESGDAFAFMMKFHRLSFPEALKELAGRAGIDLPEKKLSPREQELLRRRERLYGVNEAAAVFFHRTLLESSESKNAREYLHRRGIPDEAVGTYRLGHAPHPDQVGWSRLTDSLQRQGFGVADIERAGLAVKKDRGGYYDRFRDRVLFPIFDMSGRVVAFGGRILGEGKPKYMNSPESAVFEKSRLLFGLYQHRESIRRERRAIVVEGNFDLLSLAVHGIDNVVAPLGTSLTRSHVRSLRGYCEEVILLFDGDAAGLKAAMRSVPYFLAEKMEARVALLPEGHDPDTLIREKGTAGITALVEEALELSEFVFDSLVKKYGLTLNGKNKIIQELHPIISKADQQNQALMLAHFSEKLGVSPSVLSTGRRQRETVSVQPGETSQSRLSSLSGRHKQLVDFLVLYPEHLDRLLEAGLDHVTGDTIFAGFISFLKDLGEQQACTPERIFAALSDPGDRAYVADLFMRAHEFSNEHGPGRLCDELTAWIRIQKNLNNEAMLTEQIIQAQQAGDEELLLKLLQKKQASGRKRATFHDNFLKKE